MADTPDDTETKDTGKPEPGTETLDDATFKQMFEGVKQSEESEQAPDESKDTTKQTPPAEKPTGKSKSKAKPPQPTFSDKKDTSERDETMAELRERLAKAEGQLEALGKKAPEKDEIGQPQYTLEQLEQLESYRERQLRKAIKDGNEEEEEKASQQLALIRREIRRKDREELTKGQESKSKETKVQEQFADTYQEAFSAWPDLNDKSSTLYKSCEQTFKTLHQERPELMQSLPTPIQELLAVTLTVGKSGSKSSGSSKESKVLEQVSEGIEQEFLQGGGAPSKRTGTTDFGNMSPDQFEKYVAAAKNGAGLT